MTTITLKLKLAETETPTKAQILIAFGEVAQALEAVHYVEIVDVSDDLVPVAAPVAAPRKRRGPNKPKSDAAPQTNGAVAEQIDAAEIPGFLDQRTRQTAHA